VLLDGDVDAFAIARDVMDAAAPCATVHGLAKAFESAIAPALRATLSRAYVRPAHKRQERVAGLMYMFGHARDAQPRLAWRNHVGVGNAVTGIARLEQVQSFDWPGPRTILAAGQLGPASSRLASMVTTFTTIAEAQRAADRLITLASNESSATVGGPIDVVAIEPSGLRWLQQKQTRGHGWANVPAGVN
jgi:hypothetical protein